jgi:Right handed beta helix region
MTLRGCVIDLVSGDCVQVDPNRRAWDNILIEGCTLSGGKVAGDDPYPHARFPAGGYTSENAVDTKCPGAGRSRITVRDCDVFGFRGPIGNAAAFNIKEACEAVIDRCTVHDSVIGLRLRGPARVRVTNCVLYDNDTHCRYEDHIPRLHIAHCTFGRATGAGRGAFQEQRPSPDLRVLRCLFLGEKPRQAGDPSNRAAGAATFADPAKGDYRLTAPVPVGGGGPASDAPELTADRAGMPRPPDRPADAGAYQFRPR